MILTVCRRSDLIFWSNILPSEAFLVTGDVAFMQAIFGAPYPPVVSLSFVEIALLLIRLG